MAEESELVPVAAIGDGVPTSGEMFDRALREAVELAGQSKSGNTVRCYLSALRGLQAWLECTGREETDESLAAYVGELSLRGLSPASGSMVVAASTFRRRFLKLEPVAGDRCREVLAGMWARGGGGRYGQAAALSLEGVERMVEAARVPRKKGTGLEKGRLLEIRVAEDLAITGLLFWGGLRRSEVAAVCWGDVEEGADGAVLVRVRRSKTNRAGKKRDIRLVKGAGAEGLLRLRELRREEGLGGREDAVLGGLTPGTVARRFVRLAKMAGLSGVRTHSGRVGLATELVARGASLGEVMLAGNWKTSAMIAHYAAQLEVERGAVAKYL